MIRVGVIGYGYWGPNLVRNLSETPGCSVSYVADLSPERLAMVRQRYPAIKLTTDYRVILNDPKVDAVAIATPISTHFKLALHALEAGKHVLVEKPLTSTTEHAQLLIDEAERRKLVLLVDHTFVYTGAVQKIQELVAGDELGSIYYYDSVRVNLGLFQRDVNVLWDLAVHDLSILDYVIPSRPVAVSATGVGHVPGQPVDTAYLTLFFENSLIAHVHVNWLAPVKLRRTLIGGSRKMIVYDDVEPSEKVKVYDKGLVLGDAEDIYQMLINYRSGDIWAPHIEPAEALKTETRHFLHCIKHGQRPTTDGEAGLRMVRILEAAQESMMERGAPVELECAGVVV